MPPRVPQTSIGGFNDARSAAINPNVAQPDVAGAALEAGQRVVGTMQQIVKNDEINRDKLTAVRLENELRMNAQTEINKLNKLDPDYGKQVGEILQGLQEGVSDQNNFITSEVYEAFSQRIEALKGGYEISAMADRNKALGEEAVRLRNIEVENVLGMIRQDPDKTDMYLMDFAGKAAALNSSIPGEMLPALSEQFADNALRAQVTGLAEQKRHKEARALLDENQGELSPTVFRNMKRLVKEIENGQRQEFLSSTANQIAELEIKIDKGGFGGLDAAERQVRAYDKLGLFQGREGTKVRLLKAIQTQREKLVKDSKDFTTALEEYNSGMGISEKKGAALVWQSLARDIKQDDHQAAMEKAAQFAVDSGWVPPQIAQKFENAERTDNPDLLAGSAAFYDSIYAKNPDAEGLSKAEGRVALTSAMVELAGVTYQDAAQQVIDRVPDQPTLKLRREKFDTDFEDFSAAELIEDDLGIDEDDVTPEIARAYERRLRLMYNMHGDKDVAQKAASRLFQQQYGQSGVGTGDTTRVVKLPPERYFPQNTNRFLDPEQKREILNRDIERLLDEAGVKPGIVIGAEEKAEIGGHVPKELLEDAGVAVPKYTDASGIPPYILVADKETETDLGRGQRPSYMIHVRNSFGAMVPIGARYVMPTYEELNALPEYQKIVKEEAGRVSRMRDRSLDAASP